jgi:Rtf2 RING-finger
MGGDGGVVATNRRFMRGVGTADHTGDATTTPTNSAAEVKANQDREALELLTTCALTKAKLGASDSVVACRYGRLYLKEAAVQVLLKRKMGETTPFEDDALEHVKKLSDLYPARGHYQGESLVCPVTAKPLTGRVPPAILLVPGNVDTSNIVSEFADKQLTVEDMETEYGPIERRIHLAPTPEQLKEAKEELEEEQKNKKVKKGKDSSGGKRKRGGDETKEALSSFPAKTTKKASVLGEVIRSKVDSVLQSNEVLSSLFVDKTAKSTTSVKDKKDNLFAR